MSKTTLFTALATFAICSLMSALAVAQQQEPEDRGWKYEDDAWYDITEWFDGNDYNPTDEAWGRWDDETYDSADAATSDDYDSDVSYDSNDYRYYDDSNYRHYNYDAFANDSKGKNYDYDYNYDYQQPYDYNAYSSDLNNYQYEPYASDSGDDWYYDRLDGIYQYFAPTSGDDRYTFAMRYYDYNGDGTFDAYYYYGDSDGDGIYDISKFRSLNDQKKQDKNKASKDQSPLKDAKRHSITGTVKDVRNVNVRDQKNLVVRIQSEKSKNRMSIIDLGNAEQFNDVKIEQGTTLTAKGAMTRVGDKRVLLADSVNVNNNEIEIERSDSKVSGEIVDKRNAKFQGNERLFLVVKTDNDKKCLVDCGPSTKLGSELSKGDTITCHGCMAHVNDRPVLMAFKVSHEDQKHHVNWEMDSRDQENSTQTSAPNREKNASKQVNHNRNRSSNKDGKTRNALMLKGEITDLRSVEFGQTKHQMATVKTDRENKVVVDLGARDELSPELNVGQRISARGTLAKAGDKTVFVATELTRNGKNYSVSRRFKDDRVQSPQQRQVSGTIKSVSKADVRENTRQMITLRTEHGDSVLVDLGKRDQLKVDLEQGQNLTVQGVPVKLEGRRMIMATKVMHQDKAYQIDRKISFD